MANDVALPDEDAPIQILMRRSDLEACSRNEAFLDVLMSQVFQSNPLASTPGRKDQSLMGTAAVAALSGIKPVGELEGMIAAQLVGAHLATMECYRRAGNTQTVKVRDYNLNQANKCSRTFVILLEALNKHRGKGQQKVVVEHVHIHEGGRAIVGNVEHREGGQTKIDGSSPCS